jgi:hypothetical protein
MRKTNTEIESEVVKELLYKPLEIVRNGWIYNANGNFTKDFVLKIIRNKTLEAKNGGTGKVPFYRIRGEDIIKYIKKYQ